MVSTIKQADLSAHHAALRQMRLHHDGRWTLDATGAAFHRYEYRGHPGHRWGRTAPAKIAAHLEAQGYEAAPARETLDAQGCVHHRTRDYRRDADLVRVNLFVDTAGRETVHTVRHFPDGIGTPPRFTPDGLARAATFGRLGAI